MTLGSLQVPVPPSEALVRGVMCSLGPFQVILVALARIGDDDWADLASLKPRRPPAEGTRVIAALHSIPDPPFYDPHAPSPPLAVRAFSLFASLAFLPAPLACPSRDLRLRLMLASTVQHLDSHSLAPDAAVFPTSHSPAMATHSPVVPAEVADHVYALSRYPLDQVIHWLQHARMFNASSK